MKKKMIALMGALMLLTAACDKNEEVHDFDQTLGLLLFEPANDWRQSAVNYAVNKANALGLDYDLKLSATPAQQEKALEQMVGKGISTIVITDQGLSPATVNGAIARGVEVVLFDGAIECNYAAYVSGDNEQFGKLAGEFLSDKPVQKVVAFNYPGAASISPARVAAFKSGLGSGKEVVVVDLEAYTPEAGKKVLERVKAERPDALWAQDDQVLLGIFADLSAIPSLTHIVGGGGYQPFLQTIKNDTSGKVLATTTYSPQDIEAAIDIAAGLMRGTRPAEKRIVAPSKLVKKDNVGTFIKSGVKF